MSTVKRLLAMPDVDVLTPSFDYARFIGDALDSVRLQTRVTAHHYVQDGGSSDATVELLKRTDGVSWQSRPDRGQSDALNTAFSRGSAPWVAWLNADEF